MSRTPTVHSIRHRAAEEALRALGPSPSDHAALVVHCACAHHVATVYTTPGGLLYSAVPWSHGHGDRDRHDAAHHGGHRDQPWLDWLDPGDGVSIDDPLPAGCECGTRSLSRGRLLVAVTSGERRMVID
jgi:hypothetical protein